MPSPRPAHLQMPSHFWWQPCCYPLLQVDATWILDFARLPQIDRPITSRHARHVVTLWIRLEMTSILQRASLHKCMRMFARSMSGSTLVSCCTFKFQASASAQVHRQIKVLFPFQVAACFLALMPMPDLQQQLFSNSSSTVTSFPRLRLLAGWKLPACGTRIFVTFTLSDAVGQRRSVIQPPFSGCGASSANVNVRPPVLLSTQTWKHHAGGGAASQAWHGSCIDLRWLCWMANIGEHCAPAYNDLVRVFLCSSAIAGLLRKFKSSVQLGFCRSPLLGCSLVFSRNPPGHLEDRTRRPLDKRDSHILHTHLEQQRRRAPGEARTSLNGTACPPP